MLCFVYVILILLLCLIPNPYKDIQDKVLLNFKDFSWLDFLTNTMGFFPLGYLLMLSFGYPKKDQRLTLFKQAIIIAGAGISISLLIEVTQYYFIFGRASSLFDLIANTFGTLVGIGVYLLMKRRQSLEVRIQNTGDRR